MSASESRTERIHDPKINHLDLTGRVVVTDTSCSKMGGSSDVWEGRFDDGGKSRRVAIKIIRAIQKYRDASRIEVRVLQKLKERDPLNTQ